MYLKHVAHSTLHRQAHASLKRDNVQHTQATPGTRFVGHARPFRSIHRARSRPRSAPTARRRRAVSAPTARGVPGCAGRSRPARHPPLSIPPGASCLKARPRMARLGRGWRGFHRLLAAAAACRHMPRGYRSGKEAGRRSRPGQRRLSLSRCVARALAGRRVLGSTKNECSWMLV